MFPVKTRHEDTALQQEIDKLLTDMTSMDRRTKEYALMVHQLTALYALKDNKSRKRVSPDTWVIATGNLLGILAIVAYEQKHVITSKALGFVLKAR